MATTNKINANTIVCEPFSIEMSEEFCYDNVSDTMVLVTVWECYMNGEIMPKSSTKRAYGGMTATFNRRIDAVKFLCCRDSAWHNASDVQIIPQEQVEALAELVTTACTVEETTQEPEQIIETTEEGTAVTDDQSENFSAMSVETLIVLKKSAYETYNMYLNGSIKMTQDQLKAHNARACTISEELRRKLNEEEQTQEPEQVVEVAKPQLTDETITYTIVPRETSNGIPFIARVYVPGQEVQDFDPTPSCWWMYTEGDLVMAVNKIFKGAWYLKPEAFDARVAEMQAQPTTDEIATVAESLSLPVEEVAKVYAIAQEYKQLQEADRATFAAETKLETIQVQEELQHMEKQEDTSIIAQINQTVVASITDGTIPDGVYVDQKYRGELQNATALVIHGHDIGILYEDEDFMEGLPVMAYGIHKLMPVQKTPENKPVDLDELRQLVYTAEASLQSALETLEPVYKDHVLLSVVASIRSAINDLDDMREKLPEQSEIMIYIEKAVAKAFIDDGTTPAGIYVNKKYKEELQDRITVYAWNSAIEVQGQDVDIVFQSAEEMNGKLVTVFHDNE